MRDNDTLTPMDVALATHGAVLSLMVALHRAQALPEAALIEQLRLSVRTLHEDGSHHAAEFLESTMAALTREWQAESSAP